MGRRVNIPEVSSGRSTERVEGVEEIQVHAEGKISIVHSFLGIDEFHSSISLLSCIFV